MRTLSRLLVVVFLVLVVAASAFILIQVAGGQQPGPPAAICPGPDEYGYVCNGEAEATYVDATIDTLLYEDDGLVQLELPFTFTFYGTEYETVWASSNGNLQFTTENPAYENECLVPQPAPAMGDMIAPYWDDLDLTNRGFLQTEVVGQSPERIFVVEWDDIPRFSASDDQVTFEVQLFEGSNDVLFLYQDTRTRDGAAGSQATIGLQSQEQGYALQLSCNQNAVYNGSLVHFAHPEEPAEGAGLSYVGRPSASRVEALFPEKGHGAAVAERLNERGRQSLDGQRASWLTQRPPLDFDWHWADMDGDGQREMIALWRGATSGPELVELAVIGRDEAGRWALRWQTRPLARQDRLRSLAFWSQGDLTGDGAEEVVLGDSSGGVLLVLMRSAGGYQLIDVPGRCSGPLVLRDENADGAQEIIRGGCPGGGRLSFQWDGQGFSSSKSR